jgi:hypothetical protein
VNSTSIVVLSAGIGSAIFFLAFLVAVIAELKRTAPAHVDGGAAYVCYQLPPNVLASRFACSSDRVGLFTVQGVLSDDQDTAALGLVWYWRPNERPR